MKRIRPEVLEFAKAMSTRLDENERRGAIRHWCKFDEIELVERARSNLRKNNRDPVDAANYCMMMFNNKLNRLSCDGD